MTVQFYIDHTLGQGTKKNMRIRGKQRLYSAATSEKQRGGDSRARAVPIGMEIPCYDSSLCSPPLPTLFFLPFLRCRPWDSLFSGVLYKWARLPRAWITGFVTGESVVIETRECSRSLGGLVNVRMSRKRTKPAVHRQVIPETEGTRGFFAEYSGNTYPQ